MSGNTKKKKFLNLPKYLGDKKSFQKFVSENLVYPPEALQKGIEGTVHLSYRVDEQGRVHELEIEKGIGYGCDEEAIRLVGLMRFTPVKNRGVKVSSRQKTRIQFKLPQKGISYSIKPSEPKDKKEPETKSYTYTVNFGKGKGKE